MTAPVFGAEASAIFPRPGHWQYGISWRYQKSHRHFVGAEEQEERAEESSEVINTLNLAELQARYDLGERTWVAVAVPFLMAERSSPIRDPQREVVGRYTHQARGLGDIIVSGRRWMLDPLAHSRANFALGLGLKLPTGQDNVTDTRLQLVNGQLVSDVVTVDQSIQPGDGGFGALVDLAGFAGLGGRFNLYYGASYLVNPEATNGVRTYRSRPSEAEMSIADQYLATIGVSTSLPGDTGLGIWLGGRLEGVAADDLLGSSRGFRRPGYAVSVEPGLSYGRGAHAIALAVPIAIYRNRVRSYSDRLDGRHGDAAFADYLVQVNYTLRR